MANIRRSYLIMRYNEYEESGYRIYYLYHLAEFAKIMILLGVTKYLRLSRRYSWSGGKHVIQSHLAISDFTGVHSPLFSVDWKPIFNTYIDPNLKHRKCFESCWMEVKSQYRKSGFHQVTFQSSYTSC